MTRLRRRMIQDMRLHDLAQATQRTYLDAVKNLAQHFGRSPDQLTEDDIRQFFLHLTQTQRRAKSTVRVHLFAIKFLFRHTLRRPCSPCRKWPTSSVSAPPAIWITSGPTCSPAIAGR